MKKNLIFFTSVLTSLFLVGCSNTFDPVTGERDDPLQSFNRTMWVVSY